MAQNTNKIAQIPTQILNDRRFWILNWIEVTRHTFGVATMRHIYEWPRMNENQLIVKLDKYIGREPVSNSIILLKLSAKVWMIILMLNLPNSNVKFGYQFNNMSHLLLGINCILYTKLKYMYNCNVSICYVYIWNLVNRLLAF